MQIISWIISTLLQWYVWMPIVAVLMFLTWRNYRKIEDFTPVESVLLVLEIPRTNDKQELAAEQLFASLHGILRDNKELRLSGGHQEHISFEIASVNGQIRFYVWVPKPCKVLSKDRFILNIQPFKFTKPTKITLSTSATMKLLTRQN